MKTTALTLLGAILFILLVISSGCKKDPPLKPRQPDTIKTPKMDDVMKPSLIPIR